MIKKKASSKISFHNHRYASTLDRLSAQIIDLALVFFVFLGISFYFGFSGIVTSSFFGILYFWLCHQIWGQTLGKKIIGLHLLSANAPSLNFLRLFLRETAGRLLCLVTVFLGYVLILFRQDGRGLHDFISGSIVVSKKQTSTSMTHFLGILFSVTLLFGISFYYLFFKTPLMATVGMAVLRHQGIEVSSLQGDIDRGWKVDVFQGSNSLFVFSLRGIYIKQDKMDIMHRGIWKIKEMSIDEATIRLAPNTLNFNYFEREPASFSYKMPVVELPFLFKIKALIESFQIKKITIRNSENLNLVLHGIGSQKITYESGIISVENLQTSSASVNKIDVSQFIYYLSDNKLLLRSKIFVKQSVHPLLKKDLQASFSWSGTVNKPERVRVVAFDERFAVDYFRNDVTVTLRGVTPARHILASSSFSNIEAKLQNSNCRNMGCFKSLQGRGSFYINKQKVDFKNNNAIFAGVTEDVLPFNYNNLVLAVFKPHPVLSVVSEETPMNFVSLLYYNKRVETLSEAELAVVQRDHIYFKVLRERFDPNRPRHIDTFLLRSPAELTETK